MIKKIVLGLIVVGCSAALLGWSSRNPEQSRLLQILHTNDLHSHLDSAPDGKSGGYARVRGLLNQLRQRAAARGAETLTLDAGDFSEGSPYYFAERGALSWEAMSSLGHDAVVMGNHDWLAGAHQLDQMLSLTQPNFTLLAANFVADPRLTSLTEKLEPYAEFERAGHRVAVLGVTTDEILYAWRAGRAALLPPESVLRFVPELRARNDFVILLSHLGQGADEAFVRRSAGLDLVVGGHSHTALKKPLLVPDLAGRKVPILQAGDFGEFVGEALIELGRDHAPRLVSYELHKVGAAGPKDSGVAAKVADARRRLNREFGSTWLRETVGRAEVPLQRQRGLGYPTAWSQFVVDSLRDATGADLAIDHPSFTESDQGAGPITRELLMTLYPRVFSYDPRPGWTIWTGMVSGAVLKTGLTEILQQGELLVFSGLTFHIEQVNGKPRVSDLRIGNRPIDPAREYLLAVPEGIGRASVEMLRPFRIVLRDPRDTGQSILNVFERYLKKTGPIR